VRFTSAARDLDGDRVSTVWDFGDGVKAGGPTAVHTYTLPGTHTATVTVTDPSGQTGTAQVQITVAAARVAAQGLPPVQPPAPPATAERDAGDAAGETAASRVQLARRQTLRRVLRRGLAARVTCAASCTASSELRIARSAARRLDLGSRRLGRSSARSITAGASRTVVVRIDRSVGRQLLRAMKRAGVERLRATVLTRIAGDDDRRTLRRTVRLQG
jgi:PKD repeat protein